MKQFVFLILTFFSITLSAQSVKVDAKSANDKFQNGNFEDALDDYLTLLESDDKNEKYNYRVGVCYLNTNINKAKAVPYLEIVTRLPKYEPDAMYLLGRAYHFSNRFDDALKAYNKFKEVGKGSEENLKDVDREIQNCYNAKELLKFPLDVSFENLGKNVNSAFPDYYPFVPVDESYLVFNSRRAEGGAMRGIDGYYTAGIYIAKVKDGKYLKAKSIGPPINTGEGDEEVIGLSANGDYLLLYYDNLQGVGDIYLSQADKRKVYKRPEILSDRINSARGYEISASITNDGNTIYFASDRPGGLGGTDIYISKKLPTLEWSEPLNLGPAVNTPFDEDFPNITSDGKTLYFSSKGHTSIGGYDIFKTEWDEAEKSWKGTKNIGYPINSTMDDMNFRLSANGRHGYISALRDGGLGDLDIYRVTFNETEPRYSIIKGSITSADTTKKISYSDVFITVYDDKSNDIIGNYLPNPNSGKYVIIVPPGVYKMTVEVPGFKTVSEKLNVLDKISFKTEVEKNISLKIN